MKDKLDFDLAWGGYYACSEKGSDDFSVIRILDFNRDAYHASLYDETFDAIPTAADIAKISPFIGHVPIDARGLLNYEVLSLIDRKPLSRSDLEGYMYYLSEFEVSKDEIEELTNSLINFSNEKPMELILYLSDDELQIEERD